MRFRPRRLPATLLAACLALVAACSPAVDLERDIELVEVQTGYFPNGFKDGKEHMLPEVAFKIRNVSDHDVTSVLMTVSFWVDDDDAYAAAVAAAEAAGAAPPSEMPKREFTSIQIRGVSSDGVAPGEVTEQIVARPPIGYTLEVPRSEFFLNANFKDLTARVYARRGGAIVQVGEYVIDRRVLSSSPTPDRP